MNLPFKIDPTIDISSSTQQYMGSSWVRPDRLSSAPSVTMRQQFDTKTEYGQTWAALMAILVKVQLHTLIVDAPDITIPVKGKVLTFSMKGNDIVYKKVPELRAIMLLSLYAAPPSEIFQMQARNKKLAKLGFGAPDEFFFSLRESVAKSNNWTSTLIRQSQLSMTYVLHLALSQSFDYQKKHRKNIPSEVLLVLIFPFIIHGIFCNFSLEEILLGEVTKVNSLRLAQALLDRVERDALTYDQEMLFLFMKEMIQVGPMSSIKGDLEFESPRPDANPGGVIGGILYEPRANGSW